MKTLGVVQHDSHSCGIGNHGVAGQPFPRPRAGVEHVGAVYIYENNKETVRQIDLDLLIHNRGASDCIPSEFPSSARTAFSSVAARTAATSVLPNVFPSTIIIGGSGGSGGGGDEGRRKRRIVTEWRSSESTSGTGGTACGDGKSATLLYWPDAFVDGFIGGASSAIFTYTDAILLTSDANYIPKQYHERVPPGSEPIQGLDGGVRYAPGLLLFSSVYGNRIEEGGGDDDIVTRATALANQEIPRVLGGLVGPETLFLLPAAWALHVRKALEKSTDARIRALSTRVIDQEEGGNVLYYAASVYLLECVA